MSSSRFRVKFTIENLGEAYGELVRFLAPRTIEVIEKKLPISGVVAVWQEEVYFRTPVQAGSEKPKSHVDNGTLAYWPMGSAICVFYGKTQPYSPVNVIGKITENLELFAKANEGQVIRMEKI